MRRGTIADRVERIAFTRRSVGDPGKAIDIVIAEGLCLRKLCDLADPSLRAVMRLHKVDK